MGSLSNTEIIQHTTVRLECLLKNGSKSVGTGFYFAFHKDEKSWDKIVVVTNKHVIKDSIKLTLYLTPIKADNNPDYLNNFNITLDSRSLTKPTI